MIISISGRIGSGKDTFGKILQALIDRPTAFDKMDVVTEEDIEYYIWDAPEYEIKKFADKLKDMVCILLDCTREQLEDREFKEKELGEEWGVYEIISNHASWNNLNVRRVFTSREKAYEYIDSLVYIKEPRLYLGCKDIKLTPRLLLQLLGTQCGRDILHPNVWVNALMGGYKSKLLNDGKFVTKVNPDGSTSSWMPHPLMEPETYPNWIITDTRFPNEFEAVESRGGICIKIERGEQNNTEPLHESETALDNQTFDYVIYNNGSIKELVEEAKKFLKDYKIKK